jgi:hypothetical protein
MFLGKLWVRIKGELLSARDKVSEESDLLKKPDELVEAVEDRLRTFLSDSETQEGIDTRTHDFGANQEPADKAQSKNKGETNTIEPEPPGSNPRTLG